MYTLPHMGHQCLGSQRWSCRTKGKFALPVSAMAGREIYNANYDGSRFVPTAGLCMNATANFLARPRICTCKTFERSRNPLMSSVETQPHPRRVISSAGPGRHQERGAVSVSVSPIISVSVSAQPTDTSSRNLTQIGIFESLDSGYVKCLSRLRTRRLGRV